MLKRLNQNLSRLRIRKVEEVFSKKSVSQNKIRLATVIGPIPLFIAMTALACIFASTEAFVYNKIVCFFGLGDVPSFRLFPFVSVPLLLGMLYKSGVTANVGFVVLSILWAASGFDPVTLAVALVSTIVMALTAPEIKRVRDMWEVLVNTLFVQTLVALAIMCVKHFMLNDTHKPGFLLTQFIAMYCFAALGGLVTIFVFLPIAEKITKHISNFSLMSYGNVNSQLLLRLSREAPGTYHHSIMVSDLAQAAAEAVGANGLLARIGAYYHDIGKLTKPYYFMENQSYLANPHDALPPSISRIIISSHVKEGLIIARSSHLPISIIRFIATHHGTTAMQWFKSKAESQLKAENKGRNGLAGVDGFYRYPGPEPKTIEETIVSMADSIEAASRSLKEPSCSDLEKLVTKIVTEKWNDGQFKNSEIQGFQVEIIKKSFVLSLMHNLHGRKAYPGK